MQRDPFTEDRILPLPADMVSSGSIIQRIAKWLRGFSRRTNFCQVVGTPGALQALIEAEQHPVELLRRHVTGDWGRLSDEDKAENELSVDKGFRIFSAYRLKSGVKVWVITEWDRSATTILLPDEY